MATPPEHRDPSEPSPWSEWLARRDAQAESDDADPPAPGAPEPDAGQHQQPYPEAPRYQQPYPEQPQYQQQPPAPQPEYPDQYQPQYYAQPPQPAAPVYPPQQYPAEQYPAEQYQPQPTYQPQPRYPDQQYPAQPVQPAQPQYPDQQYPPQQYPDQQYPPQGNPGQQYPPQGNPGQPYPGPYPADPQYAGQPHPDQYAGQYTDQYAGQQYPAQQYPAQQYSAQYPGQYPQQEHYLGQPDPYGPQGPTRRFPLWLLGGIAAALVALVVGGAFLLHSLRTPGTTIDAGGGSSGPLPGASGTPSESASESATPTPSESTPAAEVSDVGEASADEVRSILSDAGVTLSGDVRLAEKWTDGNGGNLLVAIRKVEAKDGDRVVAATLKVVQVTHTDDGPKVVRTMNDGSPDPCELDFDTDFDTGQGFVKDLDGDGIAEAAVAWHLSCRGDVSPALAKVALVSDGRKFILRGDGWPGGRPTGAGDLPPARVTDVDPAAGDWPDGFKDAATEVFLTLYS